MSKFMWTFWSVTCALIAVCEYANMFADDYEPGSAHGLAYVILAVLCANESKRRVP